MSKTYNITEESLSSYMSKHHSSKAVIGETADAFLVQRGKQVQQIRKTEVEAYGQREGIVEYGMQKHQSQNFGQRASKHAGNLSSQGGTVEQIQERFNNDAVYQAALRDMSPSDRKKYGEVMETATNKERVKMVHNVRDNYADKKFAEINYMASGQASRDTDAAAGARNNPAGGNMQYGDPSKITNQ